MTLLQLVTYLRLNILDDHGGVGVEWDSYDESEFGTLQLRWSNETIVANINEAINQVYRRTNPIKDLLEIPVELGVDEYDIPSNVTKIMVIKDSLQKEIREVSLSEIWNLRDTGGATDRFAPDYVNNILKVFPTPKKDDLFLAAIYRMPNYKMDWNYNDKSPELREEYQIPMLDYAAYLCYMKDEANTLDPRRADTFYSRFEREFPFTSVYSNIRKGRTANRPIRYGGL
jgi:hypothetical protein